MNIKQLVEMVEQMYNERLTYMSLCQEIAEHFYPERADFTVRKTHGSEFAGNQMTSYPILVRRELGDQIGQMLRPTAKEWFRMVPKGGEKPDNADARWLEQMNKRMRQAMYARPALFTKAAKEADMDYATFGCPVISCRLNRFADNLLYRNWHLRDVVWRENEEGEVGLVTRKWRPTARDLKISFGGKVHSKVDRLLEKSPFQKLKCYHLVVEADLYSENPGGLPYWSIYYDVEHKHIMEAVPVWFNEYIIPRWQTVSGSQYAFSPATITALPEARMIQSMAFTLLEAGEKATNPPMVATEDVVRSDVSIYAGGITWVDQNYDERLGSALRPVAQDIRGIPFGQDMLEDSRQLLAQAFYLNKLTLPERAPEMTAYEVGQRIQEYIRGALPLFEPMETDYNGKVCMITAEVLSRAGVFGSIDDMPINIRGGGIEFEYESPLHDAIEEQKGQKFMEAKTMIAEAMDIDRGAAYMLDGRVALRDAMDGIGVPATWIHSIEDVDEMIDAAADAEEEQAQLEQANLGADNALKTAQASQAMERL